MVCPYSTEAVDEQPSARFDRRLVAVMMILSLIKCAKLVTNQFVKGILIADVDVRKKEDHVHLTEMHHVVPIA